MEKAIIYREPDIGFVSFWYKGVQVSYLAYNNISAIISDLTWRNIDNLLYSLIFDMYGKEIKNEKDND